MAPRLLPLLALLLVAAPAQAARFTVATDGALPAVAVSDGGTAHVVWNSSANDGTATTHYCQVPRRATSCAPQSAKTFAPVTGDAEFAGPHVLLSGKAVTIVFSRCCSGTTAPTQVFAVRSADGGAAFGAPAVIGTLGPDLGLAFNGASLIAFGTVDRGVALQPLKIGAKAATQNVVAGEEPDTGGVGSSPKGALVAYAGDANLVRVAALTGDPLKAKPAFKTVAKGSDVRVAGGPAGVDLFYLTLGDRGRYVVSRSVNGRLRKPIAVSAADSPIFGNVFQDAGGRIHATWIGELGISYRRSDTSGRSFGKPRALAPATSELADLAVAANAAGQATVVYARSDTAGRVGGFTAG